MRRFCDDVVEHIIPFFFQLREKREGFISDLERDSLAYTIYFYVLLSYVFPHKKACHHHRRRRECVLERERERDALR